MSENDTGSRAPIAGELVTTGLPDLDVLLGDGVPRGYAVLVIVPAGELALRLTESFLMGGLSKGEGLLLSLSTLSTEEFAARTARRNIDLRALGERARIIDWYSWRRERFSGLRDEGQTTKVSKDLVNLEVAVTRAKRKLLKFAPERRAVFDFLGPALVDYEKSEALDIARSLIAKMRADRVTSFWLLSGERLPDREVAVLSDLFDGVVRIDSRENGFSLRIHDLRARPFSREAHALHLGIDGTIVVGLVPLSRPEPHKRSDEGSSEEADRGDGGDGGISFTVKVTGPSSGGSRDDERRSR